MLDTYFEGWEARYSGIQEEANPYEVASQYYVDWIRGYRDCIYLETGEGTNYYDEE